MNIELDPRDLLIIMIALDKYESSLPNAKLHVYRNIVDRIKQEIMEQI